MIGNIFRNYSACTNKAVLSQGCAANDGGVGANSSPLFYQNRPELIHLADFCPWIVNIGKDHTRAAKDSILKRNAFINTHIVLNLTVISDTHFRPNDYILTDIAMLTDV